MTRLLQSLEAEVAYLMGELRKSDAPDPDVQPECCADDTRPSEVVENLAGLVAGVGLLVVLLA